MADDTTPSVKLTGIKVTIAADPPVGGEYVLEPRGSHFFTNHEFHLMKVETGIVAGTFDEAFEKGDPDVAIALALVALDRAGKPVNAVKKLLWDLTPDSFSTEQVVEPDPEGDALPPESVPVSES